MNARVISVLGILPDGHAGLVLKQHPDPNHPPAPGNDGGMHLGDYLRAFQADFEERPQGYCGEMNQI